MSKFTVEICLESLNQSRTQKIPYRKVEITQRHYSPSLLQNTEDDIGKVIEFNSVEDLALSTPTVNVSSSILKKCVNLKKLTIAGILKKAFGSDEEGFTVNLPKLKFLHVEDVSAYLKCIKGAQIEELKVKDSPQDPSRVSRSLNTFLRNAKALKRLSVTGIAPKFELEKFQFKLEKFEFVNFSLSTADAMTSPMMELLKIQKDNVRDLSMGCFVTNEMLQFALGEMKNLKSFKIQMEKIFSKPQLKICKSLKRLSVSSLPNMLEIMSTLIESCPNVENLKITSNIKENSASLFENISNCMKKLKFLTLFRVNDEISNATAFDNLESLHIFEVNTSAQVKFVAKLLENCKNLKKFKISKFGHAKISDDDFITLIQAAEVLEIGGNFEIDNEKVKILKQIDTKLKILHLDVEFDEMICVLINSLIETKIQVIVPQFIRMKMKENLYESDSSDESDESQSEIYDSSDESDNCEDESDDESLSENSDDETDSQTDENSSENDNNSESEEDTSINYQIDDDEGLLVEIKNKKRRQNVEKVEIRTSKKSKYSE